ASSLAGTAPSKLTRPMSPTLIAIASTLFLTLRLTSSQRGISSPAASTLPVQLPSFSSILMSHNGSWEAPGRAIVPFQVRAGDFPAAEAGPASASITAVSGSQIRYITGSFRGRREARARHDGVFRLVYRGKGLGRIVTSADRFAALLRNVAKQRSLSCDAP